MPVRLNARLNTRFIARFIDSIHHCSEERWDQLCGTDYPFLKHAFLACLEDSDSTSTENGWQPRHLLVTSEQDVENIIFVMPLFLKQHSYGEYVFDWSWADASHRLGEHYYPKFLNAIPFTPATGPRWGLDPAYSAEDLLTFACQTIEDEARNQGYSSSHFLFMPEQQTRLFEQQGYAKRTACQYHWFNEGYRDFDDFLSRFSSRKRKNLKKERLRVAEQGINLCIKEGRDINDEEWQQFFLFYHLTYYKRSGREGYLSREFFPMLSERLGQHTVMAQARKDDTLIAAALYFKDSETLYGRYWGCQQEFDHLHFEACYYQGIEYAIAQGLKKFDPGAQGEHKIQRGFRPTKTYSCHWLHNPGLADAVDRFAAMEAKDIERYMQHASEKLPFKAVQ